MCHCWLLNWVREERESKRVEKSCKVKSTSYKGENDVIDKRRSLLSFVCECGICHNITLLIVTWFAPFQALFPLRCHIWCHHVDILSSFNGIIFFATAASYELTHCATHTQINEIFSSGLYWSWKMNLSFFPFFCVFSVEYQDCCWHCDFFLFQRKLKNLKIITKKK